MNPLDDDRARRLDRRAGVAAQMARIVVLFLCDGLSRLEQAKILVKRVVVKSRRFVIVDEPALLKGHIRVIAIIAVLMKKNRPGVEPPHEFVGQRGLAAAARAANADQEHDPSRPFAVSFVLSIL